MFILTDEIKEILDLTDLVLLDIKHINDEKCKELVGFSNKLELEFAKFLSDNNIPIWIRQVIIPGITDDEKDLIKLKEFIKTLKTVEKIELHPYHNMGAYKWKELGFEYQLEGVRNATEEDITRAKKILDIE
jgi:pyruvate formate lyase activating enzyme